MQSGLKLNATNVLLGVTIGRVYQVYPAANMVDIMLWDGSLVSKVQVMVPYASSKTGILNMPTSKYKNGSMLDRELPWKDAEVDENDVFAVVAFFEGAVSMPVVLGFLFPEENELLCDRTDENNPDTTTKGNNQGGMLLWKHFSNVYTRVGEDGEIEISHPSGLLIKIGTYDAAKDPDEQRTQINNYDKKLRPFNYLDPETGVASPVPTMHIYHPAGTYIKVDTEGSVEIYVEKDVTKTVKGNLVETIEGNVTRTVKGDTIELFEGTFDKTVTGAWLRKSDVSIKDEAPTVDHN
jgi:hypothetical protein